jgi:hypothetical protein
VLRDRAPVGDRVAILGAGGIGFDVAEFLTDGGDKASEDPATYFRAWGVDMDYAAPGGLAAPERPAPPRSVHLLQRKATKVGAGLGKTTGWIHRTELKHRGVTMVPGVQYDLIDDAGLHVTVDGTAPSWRSTRSSCAPARTRAATCTTSCRRRPQRAPHRRRRRGRRTGRQARHQAGHRGRGRPLRPGPSLG